MASALVKVLRTRAWHSTFAASRPGAHLQTPLFVVLGHAGCGAVSAAIASKFHGEQHKSRIAVLLENILPALDHVDPTLPPQALLEAAVEANVRRTVRELLDTPEARARAAQGVMMLVGAVYDLDSGQVRSLD